MTAAGPSPISLPDETTYFDWDGSSHLGFSHRKGPTFQHGSPYNRQALPTSVSSETMNTIPALLASAHHAQGWATALASRGQITPLSPSMSYAVSSAEYRDAHENSAYMHAPDVMPNLSSPSSSLPDFSDMFPELISTSHSHPQPVPYARMGPIPPYHPYSPSHRQSPVHSYRQREAYMQHMSQPQHQPSHMQRANAPAQLRIPSPLFSKPPYPSPGQLSAPPMMAQETKQERSGPASASATKTFPCSICGKTFNRSYNQQQHMLIVHAPVREKKHTCDHPGCSKAYYRAADLQRHKRSHPPVTVETPALSQIHCSTCNRAFADSKLYYGHPCAKYRR
ncbi:hypothetical protein HDU85_000954 [Gaertneriomyces sp. JEL0708]|nr:hypothetical protein HDU85_000954 [Gaertneriomyces sp. JEL0708]